MIHHFLWRRRDSRLPVLLFVLATNTSQIHRNLFVLLSCFGDKPVHDTKTIVVTNDESAPPVCIVISKKGKQKMYEQDQNQYGMIETNRGMTEPKPKSETRKGGTNVPPSFFFVFRFVFSNLLDSFPHQL